VILLAVREIYRLDIKVGVSGDVETKSKLTAMEKMAEQTKKKMQVLDKIKVNPTAKVTDQASSTIEKISSRSKSLSRAVISPTARINDQATSQLNKISTTIKRLDNTNITANLRINDQTSTYLNKVHAQSDKLKDTNINPTAKIADQASEKLDDLNSKVAKFKSANMTLTAKVKDEASATIDKIENETKKTKESHVHIVAHDDASPQVHKIDDSITSMIKNAAKNAIAFAIVGTTIAGSVGAIKGTISTYTKFEQGLSNVQAVTDATDAQMKQLSDTAKSLGASTAWSATQVTDAEQLLGQAGYSVNETITALPGLLSLASAGSLDLSTATSIASSTLRAFNLDASQTSHVADVLAQTANATNSDVTDLGESLKYVSPVAQSLGISMEDAVAATGLLSNQAIVGSQAGTVLRQTLARLASPTKEAAGLMQTYGINAFDAQGNMKPLSAVVDNLNSSLGKLTSQQRADVISTIFGTESMSGVMALMNQGGQSLSDLSQKLKDAKGAADKMAETKLDNLAGQWEQLKGAVETMQINLGEKLAPYAKEFVTWLTGKMPEIESKVVSFVDYVSNHTDEIKSLAETVIGLGVAFEGLSAVSTIKNGLSGIASFVNLFKGAKVAEETVAVTGGLSKLGALGSLLPGIFTPAGLAIAASVALIGTAVIAESNLMKKSITTTTEELDPMERIMNELNGHLNKSKKEMVDLGLIYDDFGDGISDKFKKSAEDASKSLLKIEMGIRRLTQDDSFSDSDNNQLKNWVNDFAYEGINAMRQKQSEIRSEFEKTFSLDGVTSTAEQGVMDYLSSYFDEGVNKELSIRDEIYKIGDQAIKDHGAILDGDMQQIKEKLAELQAIKLEYANAENAGERAYAKSKFSSSAERVTGINGASELLQERAKEHQNSIDETKANYDKTIATTQYLMDNESDPDKKATLQKGLDEATAARDKALKQAEEDWKSDLATLYEAYPKAKGMLNEDTGAKFSDGEIKSQQVQQKIEDSHSGLSDITKSGVYALTNNTTKDLETLYVSIDETTGKIKGVLNGSNGDIGAYSDAEKEKLLSLQNEYSNTGSAIQQLVSAHAMLNTNTGQVINNLGDTVGQLQNVQVAADGSRTGILNLNGTPVQITSNASGEITNMEVFKGSIDDIPPSKDVQISSNADQATSDVNGTTSAINSMPEKKTVTITTIFKKITQWFEEKFSGSSNSISDAGMDYGAQDGSRFTGDGYATGTMNATSGIHQVAEKGFEIVFGKQTRLFSGGEKVLNHEQSKAFLQNQQNNEPFQVKQEQYQLVKPQPVQVAGVGGNNVQVSVQVNGNQDIESLIEQTTQEVGRKLKESLTNIKK
jgi:phage tail tape measure protein, TP901 family, core region